MNGGEAYSMEKNKAYVSVGDKLVRYYFLLGFVPLLFVCLYTFSVLRTTLKDDAHRYISSEAERVESLMNAWAERYSAMIDSIYMDYYFNAYITDDYENKGYEEMYPYIDKTLLRFSLICPEYTDIEFYSYNDTLPEDGNYLRNAAEMKDDWFQKAEEAKGVTLVAGINTDEQYDYKKTYICLVKLMNYYKYSSLQNVLQVQVDAHSVCDMIKTQNQTCQKFVLNKDNIILAASDKSDVGKNIEELLGDIVQWGNIDWGTPGSLIEQEEFYMVTQDCEMDMKVLVMEEKNSVLKTANQTGTRILLLIAGFAMLAIVSFSVYGRKFTERIDRIVYATGRLRRGDFSYYVREQTNDEIGKVADAMDDLTRQMEILIHENYTKQLKIQDSEMNLLYEQIDPHFLYNALATISSLSVMEGDGVTNRCVKALGEFYRVSLNKGKRILTVREELDLLKSYMFIQKLRFDDSIDITYDISEKILDYYCLKLLLQPLVENSIKYGIRDNDGKVLHIRVWAYEEKDCVCFVVEDDGVGIEKKQLKEVREAIRRGNGGYGLKNMDIRIKMQYGQEYGLKLESEEGVGTKVTVRIPSRQYEIKE